MKKLFFFTLCILLTGISQAASVSSDGPWFACADRDYYEKMVLFAVQQDREAWTNQLITGLLSGQCIELEPGKEVFITDRSIFDGMIKIRVKGDVREFWTNLEATKN